ncbi:hypothetical protein BGX29_007586 [Mortierella sp. GBA35]|nr:hypothetical protein BGX29_007586 [Mortierella sp. GBA35]
MATINADSVNENYKILLSVEVEMNRLKQWKKEKNKPTWRRAFLQSGKSGALLRNGHHIRSIKLDKDFFRYYFVWFLEYASSSFPQLESAEFYDPDHPAYIIEFLERCVGELKELVIKEHDFGTCFGPSATKILLKHAATLEIVRLESAFLFPSESIHQLLCSAPNLKEFHILGTRKDDNDEPVAELDANDVIKSDWVCTELEVFGCEIRNIPRPDIARHTEDDDLVEESDFIEDDNLIEDDEYVIEGTDEESITLQRGVYAQLGRLKRLRELTLGVGCLYNGYWRFDCLAMTLESGLDLLKDLKELQIVRLNDMEVYIDCDKEQEWVKENWPKIEEIAVNEIGETVIDEPDDLSYGELTDAEPANEVEEFADDISVDE